MESSHVASLLKQAQEKVPELEQILDQRYPEVKNAVSNRISNDLRILEYELERFLKVAPSQAVQITGYIQNDESNQSNLDGLLRNTG